MNLLCFLISFFAYLVAPNEYNYLFCLAITCIFFIQSLPFVIKISAGNYVNFYTIFLFGFFFTNFFYPIVIFPIDPQFFSVFNFEFNELFINKGTALAQLSASSFILGVSIIKTVKTRNRFVADYSYKPIFAFTGCLFILFLITVGSEFLAGNFDGQSSFSLYVLQLLTSSLVLTTVFFYRNRAKEKGEWLFFGFNIVYILIFLSLGDRGPALSQILLILGLYSYYRSHLKLKYIIPLALFGMVLMYLIGLGRTTEIDYVEGNIISRGLKSTQTNDNSFLYDMTGGFVVNTRNLYVGMDYVDRNGINWGETYLAAPISVIPFGQSFFENLTNIEFQSSAVLFTNLASASFGLGTNLVADVYISFGLFGSIVLFFLFGRTVEYVRLSTLKNNDIFSLIAYFTLLSYSIYYPRTSLFTPLKFIIWAFIIFYLLLAFRFLVPRKNLSV